MEKKIETTIVYIFHPRVNIADPGGRFPGKSPKARSSFYLDVHLLFHLVVFSVTGVMSPDVAIW